MAKFISIDDTINLSPTYNSIDVEYIVFKVFQDHLHVSGTELTPLQYGPGVVWIVEPESQEVLDRILFFVV